MLTSIVNRKQKTAAAQREIIWLWLCLLNLHYKVVLFTPVPLIRTLKSLRIVTDKKCWEVRGSPTHKWSPYFGKVKQSVLRWQLLCLFSVQDELKLFRTDYLNCLCWPSWLTAVYSAQTATKWEFFFLPSFCQLHEKCVSWHIFAWFALIMDALVQTVLHQCTDSLDSRGEQEPGNSFVLYGKAINSLDPQLKEIGWNTEKRQCLGDTSYPFLILEEKNNVFANLSNLCNVGIIK